MEKLEARADAQAGHMRAMTEVITALIFALPPLSAARAAVQLAIAKEVAQEEDDINGTPATEAQARDEMLTAYLGALSARAQQRD